MSNIWFTSDQHFGHTNIIGYCQRPFKSAEEMNTEMIARYRAVVAPGDTVYFLGDVFFVNKETARDIMAQLPGTKHLVMGNHDRWTPSFYRSLGFETATKTQPASVVVNDVRLSLSHHPPLAAEADPTLVSLCGHVHGFWLRQGNVLNVGVDVHSFAPVALQSVMGLLRQNKSDNDEDFS